MSHLLRNHGIMFILSSPSGAGKSTITKAVIDKIDNLKVSISATTRTKRPKERDGIDYFFLSNEQFNQHLSNGDFLENAEVFGNRYGTLKSEVAKYIEAGIDVIFDVDWQGTRKLREPNFANIVSIYILPPSLETLESRLRSRKQDNDEVIVNRMSRAKTELSHYNEYDYIILNDDLDMAINVACSIIIAERNKKQNLNRLDQAIQSI